MFAHTLFLMIAVGGVGGICVIRVCWCVCSGSGEVLFPCPCCIPASDPRRVFGVLYLFFLPQHGLQDVESWHTLETWSDNKKRLTAFNPPPHTHTYILRNQVHSQNRVCVLLPVAFSHWLNWEVQERSVWDLVMFVCQSSDIQTGSLWFKYLKTTNVSVQTSPRTERGSGQKWDF